MMTKATSRRELTEQELEEASRLQKAWKEFRARNVGATQEWLGAESGIGSQGAVGQYLRGKIPLNIQALAAITRVIGVDPAEVSPRLAAKVGNMLGGRRGDAEPPTVADSLELVAETAKEFRLLQTYRLTNDRGRAIIEIAIQQAKLLIPAVSTQNQG